jgi:hypothetical protein
MPSQQIKVRLALREATEALIAAYWSDQPKYHLERAQDCLTAALCGGSGNKDDLVDLIANAMDDVHDMDVTFDDYAKAVADALIQSAIPETPKGE